MKPVSSVRRFFSQFRSGTRSLKATLALYFLPISVVPAIFLSFYSTRVFEENTQEVLRKRAETERDIFVNEVQKLEKEVLETVQNDRERAKLVRALTTNSGGLSTLFPTASESISIRIYSVSGKYLGGRLANWDHQISFIPDAALQKVKLHGEIRERFFQEEGRGINTVVRSVVKDRNRLHAILEVQSEFGATELASLKARREVDMVLLTKDLKVGAASFALPASFVQGFARLPFPTQSGTPLVVTLGDVRFSAFLFELPAPFSKKLKAGYFMLFLSMTAADAAATGLRVAMLYLTAFLILCAAGLILLFSNRIVEPIELLVTAMKRLRTGKTEEIPTIDAPYEIEYLVHSFNEMARNIARAREALETKVSELASANTEIKGAQSVLVQSAKMVSLGQLVAGVAHELNNPIGFISSNMHHLSAYVETIRRLVAAYQQYCSQLPPEAAEALAKLEKDLEIEFILRDMLDLTKSCVEGANRTKEIVLGLRTFSRMDESTFRFSDIHEGLRNTIRLLVSEFKDRVALHEEFGVIPEIECNPSQINQVFMNLLSNAAQAIAGKGDIWIRTRRDGERVRVEIEDNGSGMSKEVLGKIFDPFFTTKAVGKGTGLGLSIAYGLIEKHHGSIGVESEVGKGTRFTISLPIRQPTTQFTKGVG